MGDELAINAVTPGRKDEPPLGVVQEQHGPLHRGLSAGRLADPVVEVIQLALLVELEEELHDHVQGFCA
jgi:hypothetical protein